MGYPEWSSQGDGWGTPQHTTPNTRAGGWSHPADPAVPRQRSAADRYGPADDYGQPVPDAGFHTYVTGDGYDSHDAYVTGDGHDAHDDRWPDNLANLRPPEVRSYQPDLDEPARGERDYWAALLWAAGFYAVPLLILIVRSMLLSGDPDPACVAAGLGGCESPRSAALGDLIGSSPRWALALAGALGMAAVLRWASDSWRAATIGFCAAVVAGGATTVLLSIV